MVEATLGFDMEANCSISEKCVVPEEWKSGIGHEFRHYKAWLKSIGLPLTFAELGAKAEDIPLLAANLHLNGKLLGAFRPLTEGDVREILKLAL